MQRKPLWPLDVFLCYVSLSCCRAVRPGKVNTLISPPSCAEISVNKYKDGKLLHIWSKTTAVVNIYKLPTFTLADSRQNDLNHSLESGLQLQRAQ